MKTSIKIAVALAVCSVCACTKEKDFQTDRPELTFYAGFNGTKTELKPSYAIEWKSGDEISIFDGAANNKYVTLESGPNVSFSGTAAEGVPEYLALYPYNENAVFDASAKTIKTTLPAVQQAVLGTFANNLNISVANSTNQNLYFKNACGIVCVDLTKYQNIVKVELTGANGENLAGDLQITIGEDGAVTTEIASNPVKTVTLTKDGTKTLLQGKYYIVVAPQTYPNGFKAVITNKDGLTKEFTFSGSVPLARARMKSIVFENEYYFSYFRYGNNLGLPNDGTYPSQFLASKASDLNSLGTEGQITAKTDGVKSNLTYNNRKMVKLGKTLGSVTNSGLLKFQKVTSDSQLKMNNGGVMLLEVTSGTGIEAVTVYEPIYEYFIPENAPIRFKTFAIKANPKTGGTYATNGELAQGVDASSFIIDFRRDFYFHNLEGPATHKSGKISDTNTDLFIYKAWENYYTSRGLSVNPGSNDPVYQYKNQAYLDKPLLYLDPDSYKITVNPDKWIYDGEYANGIFFGQLVYSIDGDRNSWAGSGNQYNNALFVQFDERL